MEYRTMVNISVIVPVYNSERYLEKTLNSILKQSFRDFELILVDDGSADLSGEICDKYSEKDKRIVVIHKKNGGICSARNAGMEIAKGRYIAFCDNDDLYLDGLLEDNYYLADKYDADVVRFSRRRTDSLNGKVIAVRETKGFQTGYIPSSKFEKFYEQINNAGEGVWAGLYKRGFLEKYNIKFNENMKYGYEDLYFMIQIYLHQPSIVLNSKVYYHWIMRYDHSTSAKINKNNIDSLMVCLLEKWNLYKRYRMEETKKYLWIKELSARICQVIKYVGPEKAGLKLKERIDVIKYFATCSVFDERFRFNTMLKMIKQTGVESAGICWMFSHRLYFVLYCLIIGKNFRMY